MKNHRTTLKRVGRLGMDVTRVLHSVLNFECNRDLGRMMNLPTK